MNNNEIVRDSNVQHGIDDNPDGDAEKGAKLGGVGGAVTGAMAGAMAGPIGAVVGAVVGGVLGAVGSGAAVAAVDRIDNDNNISGIGDGVNVKDDGPHGTLVGGAGAAYDRTVDNVHNAADRTVDNVHNTAQNVQTDASRSMERTSSGIETSTGLGNGVPGVQTGGHAVDGTPDTRGITEKAADALTGDRIDDKTGKPVA